MASLVLTGDTSGQVTIAAPAVAGTNTLTLPALTGTVLTNKTAGTILQVVSTTKTDTFTASTTNAWTAVTGLSASITPSSSTSKIYISVSVQIGGAANFYDSGFGLFRNASQIALPDSPGSRLQIFMPFGDRSQSIYDLTTVSNNYLDSPASTSAQTYAIYYYMTGSPGIHYINRSGDDGNSLTDSRGVSTITLFEVAV